MPSPLGEYLRERRQSLQPRDVGLPAVGRRRVSGLRREEVALLAGVSMDYYVRLEQGRERNPSAQVLASLGSALKITDDELMHLFRLAGVAPSARRVTSPERVDPGLVQMMESWPNHPALILGRAYDVLAGNPLGEALFSGFSYSKNLLIKVFLDPDARTFYADWEGAAANTVAGFRLLYGARPEDARILEVIDLLTSKSRDFVRMWTRNQARGKTLEVKTFVHPEVGSLTVRMLAFDVRTSPGQQLVVYQAEPQSPSADALAMLGTLAATSAHEAARGDA